jgi:hypothetical protein
MTDRPLDIDTLQQLSRMNKGVKSVVFLREPGRKGFLGTTPQLQL